GVEPLLFLLVARAFVGGDLNQPFGQRPRLAQAWKLRQQLDADLLKDVGRFVGRESVLDRNRVDQPFVLVQQRRPCLVVALEASAHEAYVAPIDLGPGRVCAARSMDGCWRGCLSSGSVEDDRLHDLDFGHQSRSAFHSRTGSVAAGSKFTSARSPAANM